MGRTLPQELKNTARLGAPLALGELGWMSTYIVDALMIGRMPHSAISIAASSLGNTIFYALAFCAVYLLSGIDTLVAQHFGRGEDRECAQTLAQGMWLVLLGIPFVMLMTIGVASLLPHFGTPADLAGDTMRYLRVLIWSTPPLMVYMAMRRYLQGIERVLTITLSLLTAGLVNWATDWIFIFGHLGARPMGLTGSAFATCLVRCWMLLLLAPVVALSVRRQRGGTPLRIAPQLDRLRRLFRIGWPASLYELSDLGVSTCMSILCARLGTNALAAHQVVLDLDAVIFMIPLGLCYATVVRVGQGAGRNNLQEVGRSANAALLLAGGSVGTLVLLYVSMRGMWASLYTNDPNVVATAVPIILLGGASLLCDGSNSILSGAFTGIADTRTPLMVNAGWNWLIGMPFAYWATTAGGMSLGGLWIGRLIAAVGSGLTLYTLWRLRLRQLAEPQSSGSLAMAGD